jgi:hypothetical protein
MASLPLENSVKIAAFVKARSTIKKNAPLLYIAQHHPKRLLDPRNIALVEN